MTRQERKGKYIKGKEKGTIGKVQGASKESKRTWNRKDNTENMLNKQRKGRKIKEKEQQKQNKDKQ